MPKTLTVATDIQKAVLEQVLLSEISSGFWKNARPADHADSWKGVTITVGTDLGATGFDVPRNYNFVNPDFFRRAEDKLMEAAKSVDPDITVKKLKKHLISLNQILGSRLKSPGGEVVKLPRGRKKVTEMATMTEKKDSKTTVRKVAATFAEPVETVAAV
jgi:hypothetical protein